MTYTHSPTGPRRWLTVLALFLALTLVAGACGGDDDTSDDDVSEDLNDTPDIDDGDDGDDGDNDGETAVTDSSDADTGRDGADDDDSDSEDAEEGTFGDAVDTDGMPAVCGDFISYLDHTLEFMSAYFANDPAEIESSMNRLRSDMAKLEAAVPDDLKADVAVVNSDLVPLFEALEANGFDATGVSTDNGRPEGLDEAEARVNDYVDSQCGFDGNSLMDEDA